MHTSITASIRVCLAATLVITLAGVTSAFGEQPSHSDLSSGLYVRFFDGFNPAAGGLWRYATESRGAQPWRRLITRGEYHLAAMEDRIVLQSRTWTEFDLVSARLLRRHSPFAGAFSKWMFRGLMISDSMAAELGVLPGIYGYPFCRWGNDFPGPCGEVQFPGYVSNEKADYRFLTRMNLDPRDPSLSLGGTLSDDGTFPGSRSAHVALDLSGKRFIVFRAGSLTNVAGPGRRTISVLTPDATGWGNETTALQVNYDHPLNVFAQGSHRETSIAYDDKANRLYETRSYHDPRWEIRLLYRDRDLISETVVQSGPQYAEDVPGRVTAVPNRLPQSYVQVLPAIGQAPGALGTYWRSDVFLFNPAEESVSFSLRRVARPDVVRTFTLGPLASMKLTEALRALGGGPADIGGDGVTTDALVITSPYRWGAQLAVNSRTWTPSSRAEEAGGTYGQAVPAVPTDVGYSTHLPDFSSPQDDLTGTYSQFILDKRSLAAYRHNVGVVNDTSSPVEVKFRYHSGSEAAVVASLDTAVTAPPHSVTIIPVEPLYSQDVLTRFAPRIRIVASKPLPVWLSMIDNRTGDATFVPFSLYDFDGRPSRVMVPAVASTPGLNGTFWRTDLYGHFLDFGESLIDSRAQATFYPRAGCGDAPVTRDLAGLVGNQAEIPEALSYYRSIFPDVARQFTACTGAAVTGALEMPRASWMAGFTRTYTTRASDGGSFGEMLPFYPEQGWPLQHFAGIEVDSAKRVNIGMYNALEYTVPHRLVLYDSTGRKAAEATITLGPHESRQQSLAEAFGLSPEAGLYALSIIPLDTAAGKGRSWAYVSTVDNITGDPTNWW